MTNPRSDVSSVVARLKQERHEREAQAREAGRRCGKDWAESYAEEREFRILEGYQGLVRRDLLMSSESLGLFLRDQTPECEWAPFIEDQRDAFFDGVGEGAAEVWDAVQDAMSA